MKSFFFLLCEGLRIRSTVPLLCAMAAGFPLTGLAQTIVSTDKGLASYRDKNRVLLVFAPTLQDGPYLEQTRLWQGEKEGFEDRQLVIVPIIANAKIPSPKLMEVVLPWRKKYGIEPDGFGVLLVGKDGHDAYYAPRPISVASLYGIIDAMPMRRAEMKRAAQSASSPSATPRRPDLDHDE